MAARCIPAFRSCAASKLAKPNGYAPASRPERLSSATAANGFAALPSSRVSSMNATSLAPIAELHATLPSAGRTPCSPISRTACSPPTEWSPPNICRATSAPSHGVSTDALSSKQSTNVSPSRQRQRRRCPTASSNWLRLDGKQDAHYQPGEAIIRYGFHPRCGETVIVTGRNRHGDEVALIVRQPDGTLAHCTDPDYGGSRSGDAGHKDPASHTGVFARPAPRARYLAKLAARRFPSQRSRACRAVAQSSPTRSLRAQRSAGADRRVRADEAVAAGEYPPGGDAGCRR